MFAERILRWLGVATIAGLDRTVIAIPGMLRLHVERMDRLHDRMTAQDGVMADRIEILEKSIDLLAGMDRIIGEDGVMDLMEDRLQSQINAEHMSHLDLRNRIEEIENWAGPEEIVRFNERLRAKSLETDAGEPGTGSATTPTCGSTGEGGDAP